MKKQFLLIGLFGYSLCLSAQITVPASTFPAPGDQLRYVQAANPEVAIAQLTPPGGNQFWDLSLLTAQTTFENNYRPASEGVYNAQFPGATMVVKNGTDEYYYSATGTKFLYHGRASATFEGLPLNAIYQNQTLLAERHAPLNFFDIHQQTSKYALPFQYSDVAALFMGIFPITPDSVRFTRNTQILDVVDGYGIMRLSGPPPQTDFPVLRFKKTTYQQGVFEAKINFLGWQDLTSIVGSTVPWLASLIGTDTTVTYHFLNDISKEEIAIMTLNPNQNEVTKVVYKNTAPVSSVSEADTNLWPLQVFPNPASAAVTLLCAKAPTGIYHLRVFNHLGVLVNESTHEMTENQSIQFLLPDSQNGVYFCQLSDEIGRIVAQCRLMVAK